MITALAGGVGAARFLAGLVQVVDPAELTIVVNIADDQEFHGLHVAPDLDSVTYALGGANNRETGWGRADETFRTGMDLVRAWIERYVAGRVGAGPLQPGLDAWVEVWDNVGRLTRQADGLRLDRKQVVIAAFSALAHAART